MTDDTNQLPGRSPKERICCGWDDGALVYLQTRGFRHGPPEVLAAAGAGEPANPHEYFYRVYMTFETASTRASSSDQSTMVSAMWLGRSGSWKISCRATAVSAEP